MEIAGPLLPTYVQESKTNSIPRPHHYDHSRDAFHVGGSGDICWKLDDMQRVREATARGGATRKVNAKDVVLTAFKTQAVMCAEPVSQVKGAHGQDSDVDSGIVGCGKPGQRVGSTSSTDTDSSQESRQKLDFCSPVLKKDPVEKLNGLHFRTVKRNSSLAPPGSGGGPVKADHSVLKECNRRPPTPLTVFGEANQCVRFDEQLQLSEQNIRSSCRKLFATLYAQRFSYPSANSHIEPAIQQYDVLPGPHRNRSQTLPDHELRKVRSSKFKTSVDSSRNKENTASSANANNCRKAVSWNLNIPERRHLEQMSATDVKFSKQVSVSPSNKQRELTASGYISIHPEHCRSSLKSSTDSGISGCRSRCTCPCTVRSCVGYSSQSSTSSNSSTSTTHSCCCSQTHQPHESLKSPALFKSSSCSTLSSMLMQNGQRPMQQKLATNCGAVVKQRCPVPLQKTSSCSSLMNRNMSVPVTSVPVYSDSMMHVYAQVASVVPDDSSKTNNDLKSQPHQRIQARKDHIYDTVKTPPVPVPQYSFPHNRSNAVTFRSYKSPKRTAISVCTGTKDELPVDSRTKCDSSSSNFDAKGPRAEQVRVPTPSELYVPLESKLVPYTKENRRENPYCTMVSRRQNTLSNQSLNTQNGYLKSALKQPKTASHQNVSEPLDARLSLNGSATKITSEAEYAVVDKSKKNRFTSLPALNKFSSNGCISEEDQPPVPPKTNLYKSDFNLHRCRSSSPRKTFMERVNGFTRSAKNAFQRAFSTERIYRPEREERLEATGQSLHRSKSFIKGLRASLSKKRKKHKPPMAEVVPQASSNPLWDEQPSGPNSPVHVQGQLLQLNLDGSQVVELSKPPSRPYGFFVARGRVRNCKGVFVSRMRDQETQKHLAGLLDIGDEILEIEGLSVKNADIMEVNNLMANKNTLLLTVLPYICRKDI